jgi:hypothetical protein
LRWRNAWRRPGCRRALTESAGSRSSSQACDPDSEPDKKPVTFCWRMCYSSEKTYILQQVARLAVPMKADKEPDRKAAKRPGRRRVVDRGETTSGMEPMLISVSSQHRATLSDVVLQLTQRAARFRSRLPEGMIEPLSSLVREMNCYYSNLIEGHNTHPVDIQRALYFGEKSGDPKNRDLQQEAVAHIAVQRWIDEGGVGTRAATVTAIVEIHRRFYEALPDSLKWVENPESGEREAVIPGVFR